MIQPTRDQCSYTTARADREPTPEFTYNTSGRTVLNPFKDNDFVGRLDAVDVSTGETVWTWENRAANHSPILATAGGLLFNGAEDRYLRAHDLDDGGVLWQVRLGSRAVGGTITFAVDGRQYVATVGGTGLTSSAALTPEVDFLTGADMVYVFALPE
jgi:alcohol dehydrogenase (cytochrome c)